MTKSGFFFIVMHILTYIYLFYKRSVLFIFFEGCIPDFEQVFTIEVVIEPIFSQITTRFVIDFKKLKKKLPWC